MPLLPQLLFTNTHTQAGPPSTPATPPPLQLATPTSLSRVHKRLKLSSAPPSPVHPKHTQPPPRQMPGPPHRQQIARVITDPGAPPGCAEHSLNILGGHYLLLDHLEGSHLQRCIDVNTKQEYVCKVSWNKLQNWFYHGTYLLCPREEKKFEIWSICCWSCISTSQELLNLTLICLPSNTLGYNLQTIKAMKEIKLKFAKVREQRTVLLCY